ncbi:hypothetical protein L2E82_42435 [Cichorium intybus]|uniref:Uncharacterized protein n=2 Tax=Cichorium intybus TaxID=13427 RepID=A0ACB8ZMB4_CICIN|nr:hypothetical protein L2E82_42434 [Cichorium intybus]KAI3698698.1 hypothetical protein L2E82_42435 [Cichorium intybus]
MASTQRATLRTCELHWILVWHWIDPDLIIGLYYSAIEVMIILACLNYLIRVKVKELIVDYKRKIRVEKKELHGRLSQIDKLVDDGVLSLFGKLVMEVLTLFGKIFGLGISISCFGFVDFLLKLDQDYSIKDRWMGMEWYWNWSRLVDRWVILNQFIELEGILQGFQPSLDIDM